MSVPQTTKQWSVTGKDGFSSLEYNASAEMPKLGDSQVLVKIGGVSLNYRDLIIPKGKYPFPTKTPVVPGSDGAGEVVAVGSQVTRFKKGDKVLTLFNQQHIGGSLDALSMNSGLGGAVDGTLRQYGAFDENGLVSMPSNLDYVEASTLPCAGLTAWNALFGLQSRALKPGQWVVTQGTGGVSIFALQFAKATGAKVIATTSSATKGETLKRLGADHVINYKDTPEWGKEVKKIVPTGADHIVEVAGPASMRQSINAIAIDGVITIIGFLGGANKKGDEPGFVECLSHVCTVRGVLVGNRVMMEDMCRAVEANGDKLKPVVDPEVFSIEKAKDAYQYQWDQKHFGKVCIKVE